MVHEVFGVDNSEGLGEVLERPGGELPFRKVGERLTVLPAGRVEQPMEGLTSDAMRLLLEQCSETFDWVLLDAPPVGMMPDARLLAVLTRAVLFVIAARSTPHDVVSRALGEFDPECVIGTLLNRVEQTDIPAQGYYKDYY
jgi:Mrp family chromosome partitioning ATPase